MIFLFGCSLLSPDINDLPKGEKIASYDSPSKEYTITIFLCGGGATSRYSIRGEIINHTTNHRRNIYGNITKNQQLSCGKMSKQLL